jgi:hypothetical protein
MHINTSTTQHINNSTHQQINNSITQQLIINPSTHQLTIKYLHEEEFLLAMKCKT